MSTDLQTPEVGNSEKDGLLQQWKERAEKAEAENKRLRELLEDSASLLEEFESDFNNGQSSIHRWQRQYDGAKQREAAKENSLTEGKE